MTTLSTDQLRRALLGNELTNWNQPSRAARRLRGPKGRGQDAVRDDSCGTRREWRGRRAETETEDEPRAGGELRRLHGNWKLARPPANARSADEHPVRRRNGGGKSVQDNQVGTRHRVLLIARKYLRIRESALAEFGEGPSSWLRLVHHASIFQFGRHHFPCRSPSRNAADRRSRRTRSSTPAGDPACCRNLRRLAMQRDVEMDSPPGECGSPEGEARPRASSRSR